MSDKKKKSRINVTYTTGCIPYNLAQFNKRAGTVDNNNPTPVAPFEDMSCKLAAAASYETLANSTAGLGDGAGEGGEGMGESLIKEDSIYVPKMERRIDIPDEVKVLPQDEVSRVISTLAPEELFKVGYITPIYFYKQLVDKLNVIKLTEFEGYTGLDYRDATPTLGNTKAIDNAKAQAANPYGNTFYDQQGNQLFNTDNNRVKSGKDQYRRAYGQINKTVKQPDRNDNTDVDKNIPGSAPIKVKNLETILFYPKPGSKPKVKYFVKLASNPRYMEISREYIVDKIYELALQVIDKLGLSPDLAAKTRDKAIKAIETDDLTAPDVTLSAGDERDAFDIKIIRPSVRALYLNQVYYISTDKETLGGSLMESLTTEALTEDNNSDINNFKNNIKSTLKKWLDSAKRRKARNMTNDGYILIVGPEKINKAEIVNEFGKENNVKVFIINCKTASLESIKKLVSELEKETEDYIVVIDNYYAAKGDITKEVIGIAFNNGNDRYYHFNLPSLLFTIVTDISEDEKMFNYGIHTPGSFIVDHSNDYVGYKNTQDESLTEETKRYIKRYYIRPQNIVCSNKEEILKALVEIGDENCSVYSLKNLADHDDVHLLTNKDIIYYYDDGILYDKNHVKVMDYELGPKHEEERKKVNDVDDLTNKEFSNMYDDRLTDADLTNDETIKVKEDLATEDINSEEESKIAEIFDSLVNDKATITYYTEWYESDGLNGFEKDFTITDWEWSDDNTIKIYTNSNYVTSEINITELDLNKDNQALKDDILESLNANIEYDTEAEYYDDLDNEDAYKADQADIERERKSFGESVHLDDDNKQYCVYINGEPAQLYNSYEDAYYAIEEQGIENAKIVAVSAGEADYVENDISNSNYVSDDNEEDEEETTEEDYPENPFDLKFEAYNANGKRIVEGKEVEEICCICGEPLNGYGNNPAPYKEEGRCCDACNIKFVIPARLAQLANKEAKEE